MILLESSQKFYHRRRQNLPKSGLTIVKHV